MSNESRSKASVFRGSRRDPVRRAVGERIQGRQEGPNDSQLISIKDHEQ